MQLILALDLIRNAAIREGHAVGPILTLSYKNHALDQIMLDIIKHADTPSFRQPRAFVRCGMAEDPKLKDHTEQRTREEKRAQARVCSLRAPPPPLGVPAASSADLQPRRAPAGSKGFCKAVNRLFEQPRCRAHSKSSGAASIQPKSDRKPMLCCFLLDRMFSPSD